jgi:hypothetical protein
MTLRHLDAFVGPSASRLDFLFNKTQNDARLKGAGTGWLVLTVHDLAPRPSHFSNGGLDLYAVDGKHSLVCRPFVSLRIAV